MTGMLVSDAGAKSRSPACIRQRRRDGAHIEGLLVTKGKDTCSRSGLPVVIPTATLLDRTEAFRQDAPVKRPREPTMQSKMAPWAFVLAVPDMNRSAEYFRDVLGFRTSWEGATDWRLAERDGVRIMLGQCPTDVHPSALGSHNWFGYLDVDDVDGLHAEFVARGAVCSAPKDTDYGMREIVVTTIDGHRLVCGQPSKRT